MHTHLTARPSMVGLFDNEAQPEAITHDTRHTHYCGPHGPINFTQEKRLAAEVLRQAFADLEDNDAKTVAMTRDWFDDDGYEVGEHPGAFVTICDTLGFDAEHQRRLSRDPARVREINERLRREWNEGGRKA